SKLNRS
ncbi:hypothetical protein VCHC59B1_3438B, partial [Vibrio cholerae HC-59B1]